MLNQFEILAQEKPLSLAVQKTVQGQDGCVTASARAIIPSLGVNFDRDFLPKLQAYQLDPNNPENNHMLGVAVVGAEEGLQVAVHKLDVRVPDILPPDVPELARRIHPHLVEELWRLEGEGKLTLLDEPLSVDGLRRLIRNGLEPGMYTMPFLDWARWNTEAQKRFGNPRHIVSVYGLEGKTTLVQDPSLEPSQNPVRADIEFLHQALNEKQQIVMIGRKKS